MKKPAALILSLLALLLFAGPLFAEGTPEADRNHKPVSVPLEEALRAKGAVIIPERFLRGYDPITVFYGKAVGPAGGGPLDHPGDLLEVSPSLPGEFRFLDERTVQFLPAVPWPALKTYAVRARQVSRSLTTLMVPPSGLTPAAGSKNLEPLKAVTLTFPNEVKTADLAAMISFEVKPLPGVGGTETTRLSAGDFTIKMLDKTGALTSNRYQLTLKTPVPYGKLITLSLRLSLDEGIEGSLASYTFATKPEFRLLAMGAGSTRFPVAANGSVYNLEQAVDCGGGKNPLTLEFSEELAPLGAEALKRLVRFEPAVRDLRFEVEGGRLNLFFNADKETPYKFKISYAAVSSLSGRSLMPFGETSFYFYYRQLTAYLQWKSGQAVVERFGPKLFPMQGRGLDRADVRVYKIDPVNRNFWPFPSDPLAVDEDRLPPMPGEEPDYAENVSAQIRLLGTPHISQIVNLPIKAQSSESHFGLDLGPMLERLSGADAPGTYLVGYRLLGAGSRRVYVRLAVTDLSLSVVEEENAVVFTVTSLRTGQPVAGARVTVEGEREKDRAWVSVISGVTDGQGFFRFSHTAAIDEPVKRIIVSSGDDRLVFDPRNPPPFFANNHWSDEDTRWLSWINSDPRAEKAEPRRRAYLFTERPIYRPEEPVYIMGYVRLRRQGSILADDAGRARSLVIHAPGGKQFTQPVALGPNGGFSVKFDRKDLPTGDYSATLQDVKDGAALASVEFRKEAYRVPRFELTLSGPDRVPLDREFEVVLTADYYAGGRVVGESVTWEVTKYPYAIRPAGLPGFLFSADESVSGGRDGESDGTRVENAVTDADGSARLRLNPAAESSGAPRVYVVEATVRGADTQTVTAVKQVIAVPSFAIGLKLPRFLKDAASIKPEIIIIDHNEKPLAGKLLTVRLYRREWHSYLSETDFTTGEVKYHTDVVDKKIFEKNYESAAAPLALDLPASGSGVYVVEVLAKDNLGRLQKIQSDLYLAGKEPVSWQKTYAHVFETSLDQERYAPGDKATLLLKSPFQEALALVILEGPVKNEYRWVNVRGGQGLFSFTVAENMVPRVPVHALLLRGRIAGQSADAAAKTDRGRPIAMAATTWVTVDSVRNQLKVTLEHEKTSLPGRKMKMKILVKDSQGRGVNGTASLWLVDRAVLALGQERPLRPLSAFIDPVYSSLRIAETRNDVVGNLFVEETPGGDEMERAMSKMKGEESAADRDGKADDLFKKTTVRRNFMTVPYINPAIPVVNGQAEITIDLPDNLTDFSVRCVVAADFDKFGVGTSVVSIRLPVIIQSALPRFVRPGDEFTAGGIGRIVEGAGGPGTAAVEVDNLKLQGRGDRKNDSRPVQWKEKIAEQLYFRFTVPKSLTPGDSATVRMAVERASDKAGDGFELKLPVKLDNPKVRKEIFVRADAGPVSFPAPDYKPRPGTLKQTVVATYEPGAVKLISAMRYLAEYAHGCTEQRVSKLYPGIALRETLAKLGLRDTYQVPEPVFQELIAYLESTLTPQGLYGAWPGSTGYVWLTAYVVEFLTLAKKSGLAVPDKLIERPTKALKEALRSDYDYFISGSSFRERVESLASLGAGGLWDDQYAHDLLAGAFTNDLYTQARILHLFLAQNKGDTKQAKELLDLVWSKTVFKLKDKQEVFAGMQYGDFAWGGLVLSTEVRTNAQVIRALRQKEPGSPRVRLMINDLLSRADESGWGSTVDNVSALLAVSSLLEAAPAAGRAHRFEVTGGGARQTLDTQGRNVAFLEIQGDAATAVKLVSGDKATAPWLWLSIEYVPDVTGDQLAPENKGFVVERELLEYGADKKLVNRRPVKAGETQRFLQETVVEEHVRVVNPSNRNYVAVVVPFAAGFEPLNPALAVSSKDAIPAGTLTRKPTYALYADEAVTFYYDVLPAGTYDFYFRTRSGFAGSYAHPPARAELMYDLKVYGRSPGVRIVIEEKK